MSNYLYVDSDTVTLFSPSLKERFSKVMPSNQICDITTCLEAKSGPYTCVM